jgi:hypothetical protein
MIESLNAHQLDRILELGAWRDEGRRFAVGKDGEVSKHQEVQKESSNGSVERRQGAFPPGASAPSASPGAPPSPGASASPEPAREDRVQALKRQYAEHLQQVKCYYPSLISRDVRDGLWVIVQSYPLGRDGPRFWICLFLPYSDDFDPMAFAFWKISPLPRPIGLRHTNYPDASICAFIPDDDAWRPGDSPMILLNLYVEWIICHLYFRLKKQWPGAQFGPDAVYRNAEFGALDWCTCDSGRRYGACHMEPDRIEVEGLKQRGEYVGHGSRKIPPSIQRFAKSMWQRIPISSELRLHPYRGLPPRNLA